MIVIILFMSSVTIENQLFDLKSHSCNPWPVFFGVHEARLDSLMPLLLSHQRHECAEPNAIKCVKPLLGVWFWLVWFVIFTLC